MSSATVSRSPTWAGAAKDPRIASVRKVPGTERHSYTEAGGGPGLVSDYRVQFEDGRFPVTTYAVDRDFAAWDALRQRASYERPSRAEPAQPSGVVSYTQRFASALGALCTREPTLEMCASWLFSEDERLQSWVLSHQKPSLQWVQGLGMLDAAQVMADQPEETAGDDTRVQYGSLEEARLEWLARQAAA